MKKIPLTQGKFALVDDEDFMLVNQHKWTFTTRGTGYASRNAYLGGGRKHPIRKTILMHRFIMGVDSSLDVDHINHDTLDNRRSNLRLCTTTQNMQNQKLATNNKTGFKGVHFNKRDGKYQANIRVDGVLKWLGYYKDPKEAARAYNDAAREAFGQYANLNEVT